MLLQPLLNHITPYDSSYEASMEYKTYSDRKNKLGYGIPKVACKLRNRVSLHIYDGKPVLLFLKIPFGTMSVTTEYSTISKV